MTRYNLQSSGDRLVDRDGGSPAASVEDLGADLQGSEVGGDVKESGDEHGSQRSKVEDGLEESDAEKSVHGSEVEDGLEESDAEKSVHGSEVEDGLEESDAEKSARESEDEESDVEKSVHESEDEDDGSEKYWTDPEDKFNDELRDPDYDSELDDSPVSDDDDDDDNAQAAATQAATNSAASASLSLSGFNHLAPELRNMIWTHAHGERRRHKITITTGKSSTGENIYLAVSNPPNPVPAVCQTARTALRPYVNYAVLRPEGNAGDEQPDIVFDPENDTIYFHSYDFPNEFYVQAFLLALTQEERDQIQKIQFFEIDQSWYDGDMIPAADTLLLMNNLTDVTFLEDRRGRREAEPYREQTAAGHVDALNSENPGWSKPNVEFALDPYRR